MAIPIGMYSRVYGPHPSRVNLNNQAAAELLRQPQDVYRAVITRPDSKLLRWTIAAGTTVHVIQAGDYHTITLKNVGNSDVRYGHDEDEAEGTSAYGELNVGEVKKFDIHYSAVQDYADGVKKIVFHCEWSDDMWIYNPGAVATVVEVFEVY